MPERNHPTEILQLVERLREKDETAFREVFLLFFQRIFSFFMKRGLAEEESRDLAQETFLGVHRSIGELKDPGRFEP